MVTLNAGRWEWRFLDTPDSVFSFFFLYLQSGSPDGWFYHIRLELILSKKRCGSVEPFSLIWTLFPWIWRSHSPDLTKKKNHLVELKTNLMLSNIETNEYIHCVALLYKTPASLLLLHVGWNKCCYYRLTQIWQQSEPFTHNITPRRLNCPSPGMMDSPAVGVLYDRKMFSCDRKPPRMIADDGLNNGCDTHKGFCEFELTSYKTLGCLWWLVLTLGETEEMDMLRFLN